MRRRRCTCDRYFTSAAEIQKIFDEAVSVSPAEQEALGVGAPDPPARPSPDQVQPDPTPQRPNPLAWYETIEETVDAELVMPFLRFVFPKRKM